VHSLYGGAVARRRAGTRTAADALCGNVGGQARIQETWSPPWIWEVAEAAVGGKVALDPCAASVPSGWFARENWTLPPAALALEAKLRRTTAKKERSQLERELKPFYFAGGLSVDWPFESAYVNEPFRWLEAWLRKCVEQARLGVKIVQLGPVRPHRPWWLPLVRTGHSLVYLRYDVKFQGHKQAFPAPLALCSWNCVIPYLGERETGRE
jgi:hypothetical protein